MMNCTNCGADRDLIGWKLKDAYCNRLECVRVKVYGVEEKPKKAPKKSAAKA